MNNLPTPNMLSEPFDGTASNWASWVDRLKLAFHLYQVPSVMHVQYLLLLIGPATYQVLVDTLKCRDLSLFTFEKLTSTVDGTINKTVMERFFDFANRRQRPYETNEQFLLELTKLWQSCPFGDFEDQALLNQFVLGLRDKQVQERLLRVESLNMEQAKIIAFTNAPKITVLRVENLPALRPPPGFLQQTGNLPDGAIPSTNQNRVPTTFNNTINGYDPFALDPKSIANVPDAGGESSYKTPIFQHMVLCPQPGKQFELIHSPTRVLDPMNDSQTPRMPRRVITETASQSADSQAPYRSRSPSLDLESSKSTTSTSFYNPLLPNLSQASDKKTNRSNKTSSSESNVSLKSRHSTPPDLLEAALAGCSQTVKRPMYPMWKQPTIEEIRNCCTTVPRTAKTVTNDVGNHLLLPLKFFPCKSDLLHLAKNMVECFPEVANRVKQSSPEGHIYRIDHANKDNRASGYLYKFFTSKTFPEGGKHEIQQLQALDYTEENKDNITHLLTLTFAVRNRLRQYSDSAGVILKTFPALLEFGGYMLDREFVIMNITRSEQRYTLTDIGRAYRQHVNNECTSEDGVLECIAWVGEEIREQSFLVTSDLNENSGYPPVLHVKDEIFTPIVYGTAFDCRTDKMRAVDLLIKSYFVFGNPTKVIRCLRLLMYGVFGKRPEPVFRELYKKLFPTPLP